MWQLVTTGLVAGLQRSSEALPTAKLAPERGSGHCLVVCCQPDVPWLSESLQNHYSWGVCSTNRWDALKTETPAANTGQQKRAQFPMTTSDDIWPHVAQPMLQKLNKLGHRVLPHPPHSADLSPTDHHFFKNLYSFFAERMLPQPAGGRRCFPRAHGIPKHGFLCYKSKQIYFSLAKMCWL